MNIPMNELEIFMPRPQLIRSKTHPYHVTCRTNNKDFFPIPLSEVWKMMLEELHQLHLKHSLAVHAFVLMGNHFHLLCLTPEGNLDEIMRLFLRNTSIRISKLALTSNHLWGGRYKWSLVESQTHYYQVYRYIFQNPVRAGIFDRVESYPYTTLRDVPIPLHSFIPMSFGGREGELHWLNEHFQKEDQELIRLGLRKFQFDISQRKLNAFNKLTLPRKSSPV
jgi:putative transposase